MLKTTKPT